MQAAGGGTTGPELGSLGIRRAVGASALLAAIVVLAWPVVRSRLTPRQPTPIAMPAETPAQSFAEAQASVDHLQAASVALAKAANEVLTSRAASGSPNRAASPNGARSVDEPPLGVAETNETTLCLESLVPSGTFGAGRLDWVCEQPDVWQLQLDLYGRVVSRGTGRGVPLWVQLARFELGAIAILRGACCPDAPALVAQVPTEKCGVPSDTLTALGRDPSAEQVERYADTMQCLADRKVWFPDAWAQVSPRESRRAFDDFLEGARRVLNGNAVPAGPSLPR